MAVIGRLWRGEFTLPKTFWGFYVGGIFLAFIVGTGITVAANRMHFFAQGFIVAIVLLYSYGFIATVGVWQSARAEIKSPAWMNRVWGWAARLLILVLSSQVLFKLINGGALNLMDRMTARGDF
jgi:hypothetical protein